MRALHRFLTGAICLAACSAGRSSEPPTQLEVNIDRELLARLGVAAVTTCTGLVPPCSAKLSDGTVLPIDLTWTTAGWDWRVRGRVITTDQLESYLRDELADLGAAQGVRCAPRVRAITAGDRIVCGLALGGKAFVTVRGNGTTSVELDLDAASAKARSEVVTPERERELERASRALARMADDEEGDERSAASPDASVARDPR